MGKLDTIYKVFKAMHSKEILSGTAEIIANQSHNEIVLLNGDFTYNLEKGLAKINANSKINLESFQKNYDFIGELKLSDFSSDIDDGQHKLPSVKTLLKIFSDLKIEESNGEKTLLSPVDKIIAKIKKDHFKEPIDDIDYNLTGNEVDNIKNILKILINEFFKMHYDTVIAKALLNNRNEVSNVEIIGSGSDDFRIKIKLNY